jgi:hypothetical protein
MGLTCVVSIIPFAIALMFGTSALAQETIQDSDEIGEDLQGREGRPIIVIGEPELETEEVRDALRGVAMRGRSYDRPLERYQQPLCVTVLGLGDDMGGKVAARVRTNAVDAGLQLGAEDCITNALIIVVDDQKRLIERLRVLEPRMFNPRSSRAIKAAFRRNDAAITWAGYAIQGPAGRDGLSSVVVSSGSDVVGSRGGSNVRTTRLSTPSRFEIPFSIEKLSTVMVFDVARLDGVGLHQLGDFITMRVLGQPQPRVEVEVESAASILNLFESTPTAAPPGMTELDRAYLRGLYAMRPNEPGNRLESFVRRAYEDMRPSDCAEDCVEATAEEAR